MNKSFGKCKYCKGSMGKNTPSKFAGLMSIKGNICVKCLVTLWEFINIDLHSIKEREKHKGRMWITEGTLLLNQVSDKQIKEIYKKQGGF